LLLEAKNLSLTLGERKLFCGISLAVEPGQVWAITGPSGAGKSSLLKVLTGEIAANEGEVQRFAAKGEIPQGLGLNEELDAEQNVLVGQLKHLSFFAAFACWFRGQPGVAARLLEWGVRDSHQLVGTLSGGEKQRVSVVRATFEPWQILFADEPISQLDDANARKVLLALKAEAFKRGGALVLVLHHEALAQEIATHHLKVGGQL
jgi:ABC-type phosphate/phosphonate transport system ATPase subunit